MLMIVDTNAAHRLLNCDSAGTAILKQLGGGKLILVAGGEHKRELLQARLKHLFWPSIWAGACFREIQARVALRRGRPRRFGEVCGGAAACRGGEVARTRAGSVIPATFMSAGIAPVASVRTVQVLPPLSTVASWSRSRSRRTFTHSGGTPPPRSSRRAPSGEEERGRSRTRGRGWRRPRNGRSGACRNSPWRRGREPRR